MGLKNEIEYVFEDSYDFETLEKLEKELKIHNTSENKIRNDVYHITEKRLVTDEEYEEKIDCVYYKKLPKKYCAKQLYFDWVSFGEEFHLLFDEKKSIKKVKRDYLDYINGNISGRISDNNGGYYQITGTCQGFHIIKYFDKDEIKKAKKEKRREMPCFCTDWYSDIDKEMTFNAALEIAKYGYEGVENLIKDLKKNKGNALKLKR